MSRSLSRRLPWCAVLALFIVSSAAAQTIPPSPEAVLGYPLGQHFTDYAGVREYARTLAEASPLVEYRPYGTTPERRELFQLVIARPEYQERLDAILAANAELARPETSAARAREIAASNPAVVWFSYGTHGDESSSSEAALWTAWDLARGAPEVAGVLDSLVVVIDPVANPDGRERYVQWYHSAVGAEPNPDPAVREHQVPWPGGRFNHYLFDLNRDWAWSTQPETQARLASWARWNPQVHVDFHEMGYNSSYFFFPAADPINPIYPEHVLAWGKRFGEANARAFDARGWPYFTGDSYDLFYPGYGDSWPSLVGAIGMTYEQAGGGRAGLAIEQASGDTLTLLDRAAHHHTAGLATLRTAAAGKSELLLGYAATQRSVGDDLPDVLLVPERGATRVRELVEHLRRQGIEVERAAREFRTGADAYPGFAERREFPAGTYRVRTRQPRGRLAATLLQPETELDAEYSYDISAWSLPYAYGVEAHEVDRAPDAGWEPVDTAANRRGAAPVPGYGYLVPAGPGSTPSVIRFLSAGGKVRVLSAGGTFAGREWPAGTWFLPTLGNDSLRVRATDAGLGDLAVPVASGLSEAGSDLGSNSAVPVRLPHVAVVTGEGVSPTSYGAHWFFLEQRAGLPFDALLASDVAATDLREYDVVVLPDTYGDVLGEAAREKLRAWVERGGRLVAVAGGAQTIAPLAEIELREAADGQEPTRAELLRGREARELEAWKETVPGAILPTVVDEAHPLAWGAALPNTTGSDLFVLHQGARVFEPAEGLESVAYFPSELESTSGVISEANLRRLEQGAWLVTKRVGDGSVVLFADDPLFRMLWYATHPLYLNALLLGPGI